MVIKHLSLDPVLITGMHHSGTSFLAKIMNRAGLFLGGTGAHQKHHESIFFTHHINDLILDGNWGQGGWLPGESAMFKNLVKARIVADQYAYNEFMKGGYDGTSRWGFKDPRICLTLPVLLYIFPFASLVHIIRDGRDVAISMVEEHGGAHDHWIKVWEEYTRRIIKYCSLFLKARALEINYTDLCENSKDIVPSILKFFNLPFTESVSSYISEKTYQSKLERWRTLPTDILEKLNKNQLLNELGYVKNKNDKCSTLNSR